MKQCVHWALGKGGSAEDRASEAVTQKKDGEGRVPVTRALCRAKLLCNELAAGAGPKVSEVPCGQGSKVM